MKGYYESRVTISRCVDQQDRCVVREKQRCYRCGGWRGNEIGAEEHLGQKWQGDGNGRGRCDRVITEA